MNSVSFFTITEVSYKTEILKLMSDGINVIQGCYDHKKRNLAIVDTVILCTCVYMCSELKVADCILSNGHRKSVFLIYIIVNSMCQSTSVTVYYV